MQLRDMTEDDLDALYDIQLDPAGQHMAAFTNLRDADRESYLAKQRGHLRDENIVAKVLVEDGVVIGSVAKFVVEGDAEVTYWIRREHWGRGLASAALAGLLAEVPERPIFARVAADNIGSARVLEHNGFRRVGEDSGFANARGTEISEHVYRLDADA